MRKLDVGQHIVVGTPGRVFDMISRKVLRPNDIKQFVLDEADEMLSRGFKDQIYDVFKLVPREVQVCQQGNHISKIREFLLCCPPPPALSIYFSFFFFLLFNIF